MDFEYQMNDNSFTLLSLTVEGDKSMTFNNHIYDSILCLDMEKKNCVVYLRNTNVMAYDMFGAMEDIDSWIDRKLTFRHQVLSSFDLIIANRKTIRNRFIEPVNDGLMDLLFAPFGYKVSEYEEEREKLNLGDIVYHVYEEEPKQYKVTKIVEERSIRFYKPSIKYDIESVSGEYAEYVMVDRDNLYTPREYKDVLLQRVGKSLKNLQNIVPELNIDTLFGIIKNAADGLEII